jgi:hypothetical protein
MAVPKTPLLTADCVVIDSQNRVLMVDAKSAASARMALSSQTAEGPASAVGAARMLAMSAMSATRHTTSRRAESPSTRLEAKPSRWAI